MRKIFTFSLFIVLNLAVMAQPTLIGMRFVPASGNEIVRWTALDLSDIETFHTDLQGYMLSSSLFDAYNGNYYLAGLTSSGDCLFSFNSPTGMMDYNPLPAPSNITEIDMSNGVIYTITGNVPGSFNVNQYDLLTGSTTLIGVVSDPLISGLVVDAVAFDSEHGIMFTEVVAASGESFLCRIFVREEVFSYDLIPIHAQNPQCNYNCFQYDNLSNHLFALKIDFSPGGAPGIVEIIPSTGSVNDIGPIPQMSGFVAGSSSFDQQTGSFLIVGINPSSEYVQVIFNTTDLSCITGPVPEEVSEIVCDNYNWAKSHYGMIAIDKKPTDDKLLLSPIPCADKLTIRVPHSNGPLTIRLTNMKGQGCLLLDAPTTPATVNIAYLTPGIYHYTVTSGARVYSGKLVVGEHK